MRCAVSGCLEDRLGIAEHCWDHTTDKDSYARRLVETAERTKDLKSVNLKKAVLKDARFEKVDFSGANLSQAVLSGAHFFDCTMNGAEMVGADLSNADLIHCDMAGADLMKASLRASRLWNSRLDAANLTESDLSSADFHNATLRDAKLWRADLSGAKSISISTFSGGRGLFSDPRIDESGPVSAEESYRTLKSYFLANGMYDDAGWASFREKRMERLMLRQKGSLRYIPSLAMNILCGYGEKPYRIVLSSFFAIVVFALIHGLLNSVRYSPDPAAALRWTDYIYYSTVTFTTVGYGDFIPKPHALFRLLAAIEAFTGVFLTGLFIFTLARKYSAR